MQRQKFNWERAAGIVWPLLVERAKARRTVFYGELAPKIGTHHRHVRLALGPIQSYCLDLRLPPLTAVVVSKSDAAPGSGFVGWNIDDLEHGHEAVFSFNWDKEPNPFGGFEPSDTIGSLAQQLVDEPDEAAAVYARVRVRGIAQRIFRSSLLAAYGGRCAMCGLGFEEAIEAAHIISFSESTAALKMDPRNGLLLCSSHHRLLDGRNLTVNADYRIVYADPAMDWGGYTEADVAMTAGLSGREITLPADRRLWPSAALLSRRNEEDGWDAASLAEEAA